MQLEKSFSERWHSSLYISSFNTRLGVLRGSHISNLTDLEAALERDVPFFTEPDFTYTIEAPFQKVNHHLLKLQSKYFINATRSNLQRVSKDFKSHILGHETCAMPLELSSFNFFHKAIDIRKIYHFIILKMQ